MVPYTTDGPERVVIYEQDTKDPLMGVFNHYVFRAPTPYNSPLFGAPTNAVLLRARAPGTAAEGILPVLIDDLPVIESTFPNLTRPK
jgi:hypothetical protein